MDEIEVTITLKLNVGSHWSKLRIKIILSSLHSCWFYECTQSVRQNTATSLESVSSNNFYKIHVQSLGFLLCIWLLHYVLKLTMPRSLFFLLRQLPIQWILRLTIHHWSLASLVIVGIQFWIWNNNLSSSFCDDDQFLNGNNAVLVALC